MSLKRVSWYICVLLIARAAAAQDLAQIENKLKAEYEGKPLMLAFAVRQDVVAYDYDGNLKSKYSSDCAGAWARHVRVQDVKLTPEELVLSGTRLRRERGPRGAAVANVVTVRVDAGGQPWTEERAFAAMRNIRWKVAAPKDVLPAGASPAPPGSDPDVLYLLDGQPVYKATGVSTRPKPISARDPEYTDAARRAKIIGSVAFLFVVNEDGSVSQIRPASQPLGYGLDESAADTLARWTFEPATRNGKPVKVDIATDFSFCLWPR